MLTPCVTHTHTHPFNGPFSGLPEWAGTRKVKPIWNLLKQETVSGSGISWGICKSASRSRQITTPTPHRSVFYRPNAIPAAQPTESKHWRQNTHRAKTKKMALMYLMVASKSRQYDAVKTSKQIWTVVNAPTAKPRWTDWLIARTKLKSYSKANLATIALTLD